MSSSRATTVSARPVIEAARLCAAARAGPDSGLGDRPLAGPVRRRDVHPGRGPRAEGSARAGPGCPGRLGTAPGVHHPLPALPDRHRPRLRRPRRELNGLGSSGRTRRRACASPCWRASPGWERPVWPPSSPGVSMTKAPTVLAGRCDEDMGVPYQPFVEALRHFVDHVSRRRLVRPASAATPANSCGSIPSSPCACRDHFPPPLRSDPETERYRLFDAVTAWLAAASADDPLLLVLDDLQWATKPTLLLLRHLMRAGRPDAAPGPRHLPGHRARPRSPPDRTAGRPAAPVRGGPALALRARRRGVATFVASRQPGTDTGRGRARPGPGRSMARRRAIRSSSGRCSATWRRVGPSSGRRAAGPPGFRSTSWGFPKGCGRWWAAAWPACPATPTRPCGWRPSSEPTSSWTWCRRRAISAERRCSPPWRKRSPPGW